jgi:hypothetical protein
MEHLTETSSTHDVYSVYAQVSLAFSLGRVSAPTQMDAEAALFPTRDQLKQLVLDYLETHNIDTSKQVVVWSINASEAEKRIQQRMAEKGSKGKK